MVERIAHDAIAGDVAPDGLTVTLLGGFSVAVGSRVIAPSSWRLRKAGQLVKLLALAPQRRMHREQALDTLWPHLDPTAAGNNLRVTLHFARKLLDPEPEAGSGALQVVGELLVLFPGREVVVDVDRFEELARTALRSDDPVAYTAALDLYGGELLPEDRFEEWAIERRTALQSLQLTLQRNLARLYEARGETDHAIETLRAALAIDPVAEALHLALMRLYTKAGRRAQALRQYQRLRETLQRELDIEPDPETTRLYEAILTGTATDFLQPIGGVLRETAAGHDSVVRRTAPQEPRTNLPAQLTSFVGREHELDRLSQALDTARLVTLTGPGGAGKTRLAIEVAGPLLEAYAGGIWLVDLTSLSDAALVPRTVAVALGVQEAEGRQPIDTLADALGGKRLLLVLDNCEHVIAAAAELADQLLRRCPQLRMLATSREALRVPGEVVWPVPALAVPDAEHLPPIEVLARVEAVQLFVERARLSAPDLRISTTNAVAIAAICERLDGLPLAIELAAARVNSLPVGQLAARIDQALPLLTGGSRPGPARHRSLQATISWSYDLLSPPEQRLLARLAVFAGSFSIEAAEAICSDQQVPAGRVLDLLFQLVDKSLVVVDEHDGEVRYRLLETIRQFARELLERSDERDTAQRAFRDWYRALVERAEPELLGPGNVPWMRRIWSEIDNIRVV
ncbi:MAG TPA: BTAD domain-containing putative transcriptional regulator, partial [Thermomicrobiales bacterium]|nr:BTAD domain-containing putative transcriptional regulator [Thermomicrobiales bacterium]